MPQHINITLQDAISLYKSGDLTAKGAVRCWIQVYLKEGQELSFDFQKVCGIFGMGRSTFWTAMNQLKEQGIIYFENERSIRVRRLPESSI